jgi:hypothetical protein
MVSLMSNIDADIATKAATMEHLNHLPPRRNLCESQYPPPDWDSDFPMPPQDSRMEYTADVSKDSKRDKIKKGGPWVSGTQRGKAWLRLLRNKYGGAGDQYKVKRDKVVYWKKYHICHKCFVGSEESQNALLMNRRDDSYIWWVVGGRRRYGRVVIFAVVYDWEPVAIVKPYKKVREDRRLGTTEVIEDLGAMETLNVGEIRGLVGRIQKRWATFEELPDGKNRKHVHIAEWLVGDW